jgi:hypothetical protein
MGLFKRIKDPVRGTAQVIAASRAPEHASRANCKMTLVVEADGVPARTVEHHDWAVPLKRWPIIGETLPVTVSRTKTDRVKIEWGEVPTHEERARRQADAIAASRGGGAAGAGDVPPHAQDIVDQVTRMFPDATVHVSHDGSGPDPRSEARIREALGQAFGGEAGDASRRGGADRISELERLAALRDKGVLTESEFQAEKARMLGS